MVELRVGSKTLISHLSFVGAAAPSACARYGTLNTLQSSGKGRGLEDIFAIFEPFGFD